MSKEDTVKIRDEIILAMLPHVSFDGWGADALSAAADEAGHGPDVVRAALPAGTADALDGFADLADRWMIGALADIKPEDLRIRDRVRAALLARFEALDPHKDAVRQGAKFWAIPTHKSCGIKTVWRTADRIWEWAGDEATDYNRYTKRGLLSGIIVPTTLTWLNDTSEDMNATKDFLDKRIENVMQLGRIMGRFKNFKMSEAS